MSASARVALLAAGVFVAITYAITSGTAIVALDGSLVTWVHARAGAYAVVIMRWVSASGGPSVTSCYAAALIVVCIVSRRNAVALAIAVIVYGGAALNVGLKEIVQRARPALDEPLVSLPTYSFPSGHAAAATVFAAVLIMLVARSRVLGRRLATLANAAIVLWVAAVCASRVYLGAHYPSDVAAGVLEGVAWTLGAKLALERIEGRRRACGQRIARG